MKFTLCAMLSDSSDDARRDLLIAVGAVGLVLVIGAVVIQHLRRGVRQTRRRRDGTREGGFGLEELERMRRDGGISDSEFRRLRRLALGLGAEEAKMGNSASSDPVGADDDDNVPPADESCADGGGGKE